MMSRCHLDVVGSRGRSWEGIDFSEEEQQNMSLPRKLREQVFHHGSKSMIYHNISSFMTSPPKTYEIRGVYYRSGLLFN